jgi:hypothetical protein
MSRNFGFGKHSKTGATDDLLMPTGPIWAICIAVVVIIVGATFL